jgi:ADP-heptose:LPS heptosyltransferase
VAGEIQNLVGRLDFNGLLSALSTCDLLFGNDTGTMHLAAACGIPAVTLFGPTEHRKWNALTSTPVSKALDCSPCYYLSAMPECPHINCLNQLSPKTVLEVIEKKIKEIS